jgi:hypothetical protein
MKMINILNEAKKDPFFIDSEMYLEVNELVKNLRILYARCDKEFPVEFENFQKAIEVIYEQRVQMETRDLCRLLQKADKWLFEHPSFAVSEDLKKKRFDILAVYTGCVEELKLRGIGEYEALKVKFPTVRGESIDEIFGELVEQLDNI